MITKGELMKVTMTWRQAHFGAVMSGLLQIPHTGSNGTRVKKEVIHSSWGVTLWGEGIQLGQCQRPCPHHTEGLHPPIQYHKCACQFQCQRTLCLGACAHGTNARSPVACSSGANGDLQRTTSGVLKGTCLSAQCRSPFHRHPCRLWLARWCPPIRCHWWFSQPGLLRNLIAIPRRDGSWRSWTSKALGSGPSLSRNRPENCCSSGNTCCLQ